MSGAGLDNRVFPQPPAVPIEALPAARVADGMAIDPRDARTRGEPNDRSAGARRTPRQSLIVVLAENHAISPDLVADHMLRASEHNDIEVIVACAGQPTSLAALQRRVRDLQILLAPAGTSSEDLREMAMKQAPGDIVTLLSGTPRAHYDG